MNKIKSTIIVIFISILFLSTIFYFFTNKNSSSKILASDKKNTISNNDANSNEELKKQEKEEKKLYEEKLQKERDALLTDAEFLKRGYFVDEAIDLLNSKDELFNEEVQYKVQEYENYKTSFVEYEGEVEHVFFHSLIIYPELAFDNIGHASEGYNMWFTTVNEFKSMLPLLQEKGYVLVDIRDLYIRDENGIMIETTLYLPEGKKPLVISQDDVNYYNYMKPDGFATRLVLDENDEISTEVNTPDGQTIITRDGDIVPILDDYIKKNPEFSYRGAKGVLGVTGYEGVLGYRLDSEENKIQAKEVCDKLKENGWVIASHSYTHNDNGYFRNSIYSKLEYDFNSWKTKIEPIVGETNVFISPFGVTLEDEFFEIVTRYGFDIYCNVDRRSYTKLKNNVAIMPRFNLDGFTFTRDKDSVNTRFFNVDSIFDGSRPPL